MQHKVLFISENYYPRTSGVPVVVQYLAEGLARKGHKVSILTRWLEGLQHEETINGVFIFRFNIWRTQLKQLRGDIRDYQRFVLGSDADTIIFECSEALTTDALLPILSQIKAKKIFHSHGFAGQKNPLFRWKDDWKHSLGNTYNYFRFWYYYHFTFKDAIKYFDHALCLSEVDSSKLWLEKNAKKLTVLQNAVDDMFTLPTTKELPEEIAKLNKPYIVSVATYQMVKNQLDMLREYYKTNTDCAMVFIGPVKTEYYHWLVEENKKLEYQYGKRDVLILTQIPRKYIPNVIGNASLYLVGSLWEEYSISLIETMCKGVPFISTNVGNARTLPGGKTIMKISEMHTAIEELLHDRALYMQYSEAGKKFVDDNCRIAKAVSLLEKVIDEA